MSTEKSSENILDLLEQLESMFEEADKNEQLIEEYDIEQQIKADHNFYENQTIEEDINEAHSFYLEKEDKVENAHVDNSPVAKENTPEDLVSLLDLDKLAFPQKDRWEDYVKFSKKLQLEIKEKYENSIKSFWNNYTKPVSEGNLQWVDPTLLNECEEKVINDKDRNHTSCFRNLQLYKKPLVVDKFSVFDELEKEFPNFIEVINLYKGFFLLNASRNYKNYKAPRPLLLLGNPGIGKTRFVKKLAKALNTQYSFLDTNSITGGFVLTGNSASWRGADAGFIFKTLAPCPTISPVILLDEVDKLSDNRSYSPFSALHQLLEPENSANFYDEFLQLEFDASYIMYVLTANDINNIPVSLLSRMNVVEVFNPSPEHMHVITQNIYTELLSGSSLFKKTLSQDTLKNLEKHSPREVYQILSKNLFSLSAKQKKKKNNDFYILPETKKEHKFGF